jgi:hypothetical protein
VDLKAQYLSIKPEIDAAIQRCLDRTSFIGQCPKIKVEEQTVNMGGGTRSYNGINVPRGAEELIIYTPQYDYNNWFSTGVAGNAWVYASPNWSHNAKYIIELLYDSIEDLGRVDFSLLHREDPGHFAGSTMAFRDWDADGEVPAGCARCHSAEGLPTFLHNAGTQVITGSGSLAITGVVGAAPANGFQCSTCHDVTQFPAVYAVPSVVIASGKTITFSTEKDDKGAFVPVAATICLECHQGRQSTAAVNTRIKGID